MPGKCRGWVFIGERPVVRDVFIEEVACEVRAHLSLEHKCFPAIMINGCSFVSLWAWSSNNDSIEGSVAMAMVVIIMVQHFIYSTLWREPKALDLPVSLITET